METTPFKPWPSGADDPAISFRQNVAFLFLLLEGDHDAAIDCLRHRGVQPDDFVRFVYQHRLQLLVFSLLQRSPVQQWLPRRSLQQLKVFCLRQWVVQEALVSELATLSAILTAAGQEFILLKGPYVAARFCGGIDRRGFSDLDLLIKIENLEAVKCLLSLHGYVQKSTILISQALTTHFTHAFDFAKSDVIVDLHWLLSANAAHELDYDAIWQQRESFVLRNQQYSVLSDEYEVVFNLISIFKDLERGAGRLKQLVDLYYILTTVNRRLAWETFLEHRKREKILRISVNILAFFFGLFNCQDKFPELSSAVARHQQVIKIVSPGYVGTLLESSPGALRNKLWAAGLYECPRFHVLVWWFMSLPFRLAVYDPGKYARFKRTLHNWKGLLQQLAVRQ